MAHTRKTITKLNYNRDGSILCIISNGMTFTFNFKHHPAISPGAAKLFHINIGPVGNLTLHQLAEAHGAEIVGAI